jgi:hypothetical protein
MKQTFTVHFYGKNVTPRSKIVREAGVVLPRDAKWVRSAAKEIFAASVSAIAREAAEAVRKVECTAVLYLLSVSRPYLMGAVTGAIALKYSLRSRSSHNYISSLCDDDLPKIVTTCYVNEK